MADKLTAIVLGGTNPHIELIKNLKNRGYYTVLIDYLKNPPAKNYADAHFIESTLDQNKVLEIAQVIDAKLVISACIDQANLTACYVSEKLNLPIPYSYETALTVTNKKLMKQKMADNDIQTPKFIITTDDRIEYSDFKFPAVIKPVDSSGSKGVRKADNLIEANNFLMDAISISRTSQAVIEEYIDGCELSIDCFIQNHTLSIIMIHRKIKNNIIDGKSVLQFYSMISPAEIPVEILNSIQELGNKIVQSFQIDNIPLLIQLIINTDGIYVVEFAARVSGGFNYRTIKLNTGFDIINATIDSFLGNEVNLHFKRCNSNYSINHIYAYSGKFNFVLGFEKLQKQGIIEEYYFHKTKGDFISPYMMSSDRVGSFITKAKNLSDLVKKNKLAIRYLDVFDMDGNSMMRRDIYTY